MRIKLRLYARDLDLIALKHTSNFQFVNALRTSLEEYVAKGECTRIYVYPQAPAEFVLKNEQVDISLNEEKHADVIAWLMGLRPGMRSFAIKAVFRSAIALPNLLLFSEDSGLIISDQNAQAAKRPEKQPEKAVAEQKAPSPSSGLNDAKTGQEMAKTPIQEEPAQEKELDLFEDEFFDMY